MKSEWITKPLGELTSYMSKGIPPKYSNAENNTTIRVLNQKCNRDFKISYEYSRLHDLSKKSVPKEKLLRAGDVLINSTGAGTAGRVAQLFEVPCLTTIDGHMILLRPTSEIEAYYYGYAIKSFQKQIELLAEGSTGQTEINRKRLCDEIEITFPIDLNLQRQISSIFFAIDEKISTNTKINENLEQQAQAIFKSWFVDFEPFGGVMPTDWEVSSLGKVSNMGAGGDKPQNTTSTPTSENVVPIYSNGLTNEGLYGFTDNAKIEVESVTVSARGTIGYVCLRQVPYVPIVRLITLIPNVEIVSAKYLYHWLKTLHIAGTGTTQQQLTVPSFKKTEILVPDSSTMKHFTETVNPFYSVILSNKHENHRLTNLRDTLLPKLLSGEIDVSEVQI